MEGLKLLKSPLLLFSLILLVMAWGTGCSEDERFSEPGSGAGLEEQTLAYAEGGPAGCVSWSTTAQLPPGPIPDEQLGGYDELQNAADEIALPVSVGLRTTHSGFNRRFEFALAEGTLYTRAKGEGQWKTAPQPECLKGQFARMSVDEDELVATDAGGWIYTMDNALSSPSLWNWGHAWGAPFWAGSGMVLPDMPDTHWALSIISPHSDKVFSDRIGHRHEVAGSKVTQIVFLSGDGSRITYLDPWLPKDFSYEIGSPAGGRFRSVALSTSGSTTFVINQYGDMYTRLYDFDISGANLLLHRYSWQDQSNKPEAPTGRDEYFNDSYAAVQLPAPDWVKHPKITGDITDRISIHATGKGSDSRELRVEGRQGAENGYWVKEITAPTWDFVTTGQPLLGELLQNTPGDHSSETLAPLSQYSYKGELSATAPAHTYTMDIAHFDHAVTSRPFKVTTETGEEFTLTLHTVDGLRQTAREPGLDGTSRKYIAAIEMDLGQWGELSHASSAKRKFVSKFMSDKRVHEITLYVRSYQVYIPEWIETLPAY